MPEIVPVATPKNLNLRPLKRFYWWNRKKNSRRRPFGL